MFESKISEYNLILASQSPRRKELLEQMGLKFSIAEPVEYEEICHKDIDAEGQAWYLSLMKSKAYAAALELGEKDILITSDTLVVIENCVLGKPKDRSEAIEFLKDLSGRSHKVITGVTFRCGEHTKTFSDTTEVVFSKLKEKDINYYVDNFNPYDKAGAYAIQEWIGVMGIRAINGSYYNVMGLPTEALYRQLLIFINKIEEK